MISSRPILFNGTMVRALLAGTKTQTRRIMKVQPTNESYRMWQTLSTTGDRRNVGRFHWVKTEGEPDRIVDEGPYFHCPYGQPGDQLWVRETIRLEDRIGLWARSLYVADGRPTVADAWVWKNNVLPSIHCPKGLSRIALEIINVRAERLNDISEEDARAEGVSKNQCPDWHAISDYLVLWESLNGPGSWALNPWVWVIEFKQVGQ